MRVKGVSKYLDLFKQGQQVGDWTVQGSVIMNQYAKVPCKCKCGKESLVDAYTLTKGKSRCCKQCSLPRITTNNSQWRGYEEIPQSWFSRYERGSKISFDIKIEDVWDTYIKQDKKCILTGMLIGFSNDYVRGKRHNGAKCTASIDRIDSKKGYSVDNIQLVHKDINIMKNAFDQAYFIQMCKAVANNK
jgi:hypothetical protein